jgi:hypothetical protein
MVSIVIETTTCRRRKGDIMDRRTWIRVGVIGGLAFAVLEVTRLVILPPPPLDGSPSQVATWVSANLGALKLFPWLDAIGASAFALFGILFTSSLRSAENGPVAAVAVAAASVVLAISLILDGAIAAITATGIGGGSEAVPILLAGGVGVETMFPYPLALFLAAVGWLLVERARTWLGWAAWVIGAAFLASGLLPAVDLDLEVEGPLFMALLVWIVVASVAMLRTPLPVERVAAPVPAS